jgi:hypothetical protein
MDAGQVRNRSVGLCGEIHAMSIADFAIEHPAIAAGV